MAVSVRSMTPVARPYVWGVGHAAHAPDGTAIDTLIFPYTSPVPSCGCGVEALGLVIMETAQDVLETFAHVTLTSLDSYDVDAPQLHG